MNKNIIPVGYITKTAADIRKGDVLKFLGKIVKARYVGEHNITDPETGIFYRTHCVEFETKSALTGETKYTNMPFEQNVELLCYADISKDKMEILPF